MLTRMGLPAASVQSTAESIPPNSHGSTNAAVANSRVLPVSSTAVMIADRLSTSMNETP